MSEALVVIDNLSKSFKHYSSASGRLRDALFGGKSYQLHHALSEVSLRVMPGEAVAVLGRNGAGKSTLLKLVTGVMLPDTGSVHVAGRLTGLLELGAGFDISLTGLENIRVNGTLLGMSEAALAANEADIIAFSELGDFIHSPVKTYSSGMVMRLGFSIAIYANPACFIVDEALAVGDARFQQKCLKRIREFQRDGGALLFVSHDINAVKMLCTRAVVLEQGRLVFDGTPIEATKHYYRLIAGLADDDSWVIDTDQPNEFGHRATRITQVTLHDDAGEPVLRIGGGETARIRISVCSDQDASLSVGLLIRDRLGQDIFGINTALMQQPLHFSAGHTRQLEFALPMSIAPGKYTLTVAVHSDDTHVHDCQHWWDDALSFEVTGYGACQFSGLVSLPTTCTDCIDA